MVNSYNRRGISTIVGGVIFLVLLTGGFSTFYIALDVQKDTINTQREISKSIVEKTLEKFEISTGTTPVDNNLEIRVENLGVNPVEITNIWIINKTSPYPANSYDVDYEDAFVPTGFSSEILENTPLSMSPGLYDIKVVSALGTIVTEKKFDPSGAGGEGEEVIVKDSLFGRPDIFMIMPNAVGDEDTNEIDRPIWGVLVANPTDQDMFVSKVVITAMSPRDTGNDKIFAKNCETITNKAEKPVTIAPTLDRWSCVESNQIQWKDIDNPQLVEPRSVFPFLVAVGSDNLGSSLPDAINMLIQPIVFTTLGQFSKPAYGTTMFSSDVSIPNVFLARAPNSVAHADIMGEQRAITEGTTVTFYATLADMSSDDEWGINIGTKLIINIPKDWTFVGPICPTCHDGFDPPTVVTFPDGSTQIVGVLNQEIDEHADAKSIEFTATAPFVSKAKMYVMHILADGTATGSSPSGDDFTVGPIAEPVLQVCPTSGCP